MGAVGSKEVVIQAPAPASRIVDPNAVNLEADTFERKQRLAAAAYTAAEDIIFQEGYRRGQADALARIDAEAEVRTRGVFGKLQAEASEALAKDVTARAQALRERGTRGPMKAVECAAEEAALLACNPAKDAGKCVDVQSAYMQCGDGELRRAMHPVLR